MTTPFFSATGPNAHLNATMPTAAAPAPKARKSAFEKHCDRMTADVNQNPVVVSKPLSTPKDMRAHQRKTKEKQQQKLGKVQEALVRDRDELHEHKRKGNDAASERAAKRVKRGVDEEVALKDAIAVSSVRYEAAVAAWMEVEQQKTEEAYGKWKLLDNKAQEGGGDALDFLRVKAMIERDPDGDWWAEVRTCPSFHNQGRVLRYYQGVNIDEIPIIGERARLAREAKAALEAAERQEAERRDREQAFARDPEAVRGALGEDVEGMSDAHIAMLMEIGALNA